MRWTLAAAAMLVAAFPLVIDPGPAEAQSADDLKNDSATPGDILTYGMGYDLKRFSPLDQINAGNVADLVPVWSVSLLHKKW